MKNLIDNAFISGMLISLAILILALYLYLRTIKKAKILAEKNDKKHIEEMTCFSCRHWSLCDQENIVGECSSSGNAFLRKDFKDGKVLSKDTFYCDNYFKKA